MPRVDRFVRQTVVYAALTTGFAAAYASMVIALGMWLSPGLGYGSILLNLVFVFGVAVAFEPIRRRLQAEVDRRFFRSPPDYRRTIGEVGTALASFLDLDQILMQVGMAATQGFQIQSFSIVLWSGEASRRWHFEPGQQHMPALQSVSANAIRAEIELECRHAWHPAKLGTKPDSAAAAREAHNLGAALVMPLALGSRTIGMLVLGPKRSGRDFSLGDTEILSTLAAQTAIAVQNARSYEALAEANARLEQRVLDRTAELRNSNRELEASNAELGHAYRDLKAAQTQLVQSEKMASLGLLVAGVAHEINNPVSFISTNVVPLRRRLAAVQTAAERYHDPELTVAVDRVGEVLDLIARGAERTADIVKDLRTFSSPGEAAVQPVDLQESIEVTLRLLRPRWSDRITIHRDYGALPPLEAVPGQINQVMMNLLANACDAIEDRGNIWIRTEVKEERVHVTIHDDGAGISSEHLSHVFDPFFTTKPVGRGTGLGLAITHGIVAHHGGNIAVTSDRASGTTFALVLPLSGAPAAPR